MCPRSHVAEERRAQIIKAALSSFLRQGYNKTTMDDIVDARGLRKNTLYWHFDSKEELFAAVLMSVFEDVKRQAMPGLAVRDGLRQATCHRAGNSKAG